MGISRRSVLIFVALVGLAIFAQADSIFTCQDKKGKTIFTDNKRQCSKISGLDTGEVAEVALSSINSHYQYGETTNYEYLNYKYLSYVELEGYSIKIFAEQKLQDEKSKMMRYAAKKLEKSVQTALQSFPSHIRSELSGINYYLFDEGIPSLGSDKAAQWYFREGRAGYERFWDSILVRSVESFVRIREISAARTAVHELSHAYYYRHKDRLKNPVRQAYRQAIKAGLYRNVKNERGKLVAEAYALENEREYFAELSEIYHLNGSYFPYTKSRLKSYDQQGFSVLTMAFSQTVLGL